MFEPKNKGKNLKNESTQTHNDDEKKTRQISGREWHIIETSMVPLCLLINLI